MRLTGIDGNLNSNKEPRQGNLYDTQSAISLLLTSNDLAPKPFPLAHDGDNSPIVSTYCLDASAGVGPAKKYKSKIPPKTLYSKYFPPSGNLTSIPLELSRKIPWLEAEVEVVELELFPGMIWLM